jgi:hypothetical protein
MASDPYHVKLTVDPTGTPTEIGLMLSQPKGQGLQYVITEPDSGAEVEWVQRDFRGGMVGDTVLQSETNQYSSGRNFIAEPRTGNLFSGPDFKTAITVGSADMAVVGGCMHDATSLVQCYLVNNGDLYVSNQTGTSFSQTLAPSSLNVHSVASWHGIVLAAVDSPEPYQYSVDNGTSWTQCTLDVGSVQAYFIPAGDVVWGLVGSDTMRWSTDPTNAGSWSGAMTIGENDTNDGFIGGGFISQILIIVKANGLYCIDDGGNIEKVVSTRPIRGAATDWTSKVFFYDSHSDVYEYDIFSGNLRNLHFKRAVEGNLYLGGAVVGGGIDRSFDKTFLCSTKGVWQWSQFRDQNGGLIAEGWESLYYSDSLATLQGAVVSGHRFLDSAVRYSYPVYIGGSTTSINMGYVNARRSDDYDTITSLTCTTIPSIYVSPVIDHNRPGERKMEQYVELDIGGVTPNVQLSFSIDGASSFTSLGSAITTIGKSLVEFPSGTEADTVQIKVTNTPATNVKYINIKSLRVIATMNPPFRRRVQISARVSDHIRSRHGAEHPLKGDVIRSRLQTARTTGARLRLEDFMGNDFDVVILPPLAEVPSRDEAASDTESEIQFTAVEYGVTTAT